MNIPVGEQQLIQGEDECEDCWILSCMLSKTQQFVHFTVVRTSTDQYPWITEIKEWLTGDGLCYAAGLARMDDGWFWDDTATPLYAGWNALCQDQESTGLRHVAITGQKPMNGLWLGGNQYRNARWVGGTEHEEIHPRALAAGISLIHCHQVRNGEPWHSWQNIQRRCWIASTDATIVVGLYQGQERSSRCRDAIHEYAVYLQETGY